MSAISIRYKGVEYPSLAAFARAYNIPQGTVKDRWERGIRTPELLIEQYRKSKQQLKITYQGKPYYTYNSLAIACNISPSTLRDRYNHGLRGNELFVKPKIVKERKPRQKVRINYQEKQYETFVAFAKATGVSENTIRDRWNRGIRDPKGLITTYSYGGKYQLNINFQGKTYHTYNSLARACGISPSTLRDRYNHGLRGAALLVKPKPREERKPRQKVSITYQGEKYNSFSSLAKTTGISKNTIRDRWNRGIRDPEFLVKPGQDNKLMLNKLRKQDANNIDDFLHKRQLISTHELSEKTGFRIQTLWHYIAYSNSMQNIGLKSTDLVKVRYTSDEISIIHNKTVLPKYAFRPSAIKHINDRSQELGAKNLVIIPQTGFKYFWDASKKEMFTCRNAKDKNIFFQVKKKENSFFYLEIHQKRCLFAASDIEDLIKNPQIGWKQLISKRQISNSLKDINNYDVIIKNAEKIQHTRYDRDGHKYVGITKKELHRLLRTCQSHIKD